MGKRLELTGQRFGRLTVIEFSHINKWKNRFWLCKCDCGNYTTVRAADLNQGKTKSCGCILKELRRLPEGVATRNIVICTHKRVAKERNIGQALTDEQIMAIHKRDCYYCGTPPSNICSRQDYNGSYTYNGIDRVDNDKGYTMDNSVPCCADCNRAKSTLTYDDFLDLIKRIHKNLNL